MQDYLLMDEGMNFDLVGKTFYSTRNSDHFTVKDVLLEGSSFTVTTTDGRMIPGDQLNSYLQSDKPVNIQEFKPTQKKIDVSGLDEVDSLDQIITSRPRVDPDHVYLDSDKPVDYDIIDRALNNLDVELECSLKWTYPDKQISALTDIMNISKSSIAKYIIYKYFKDDLNDIVKDAVEKSI